MSEIKHSPLPLKILRQDEMLMSSGKKLRTYEIENLGALVCCNSDDAELVPFIVRAVNSHEALVEALRKLRNEAEACLSLDGGFAMREAVGNTNVACLRAMVEEADAALALAKNGREG